MVQAGRFVLLEEGAVAKGVRRITGLSGKLAHTAAARGSQLEELIHDLPVERLPLRDFRLGLDSSVISAPLKGVQPCRSVPLALTASDACQGSNYNISLQMSFEKN